MAELYEKAVSNVFKELDQVGKDYLLQILNDRLNLLNGAVMDCIDFTDPKSVSFWGPDGTVKNVRLVLEQTVDTLMTDNQEEPNDKDGLF